MPRRSSRRSLTARLLDNAFDLLPALLLIALFVAGAGQFVVTFDY